MNKTGTLHELMMQVEKSTGESVSIHHELICSGGNLSGEFHIFIGNKLKNSLDDWLAVVIYLNSFLGDK